MGTSMFRGLSNMNEFTHTYKFDTETKGTYKYVYTRSNGRKETHYVNKDDMKGHVVPTEIEVIVRWS